MTSIPGFVACWVATHQVPKRDQAPPNTRLLLSVRAPGASPLSFRTSAHILHRARSRSTLEGQGIEVQLANKILNTITRLGMPASHRVA